MTNFLGWWAVEGLATYYQMYIFKLCNWLTEEMYENEWKYYINLYWQEIVGKGLDLQLETIGGDPTIEEELESWIAYKKSALVFFIFDNLIKASTNNQSQLIDFLKYYNYKLYTDYKDVDYNRCDTIFNELLSEFTGLDFDVFYDEFIRNANPLPIKVEGEEIVILMDWM